MRKYQKGSNQYKKRYKGLKAKTWRDVIYITSCAAIVAGIGWQNTHQKHIVLSPVPQARAQAATSNPMDESRLISLVTQDQNITPSQDEIEAYITRIFGSEAKTAIAISNAECNPANSTYPRCVAASPIEHSVGIFQINLYNASQSVHADRIPGTTMEEKELWLKNPFNNTLYAYWVYSTSGFGAWSTYLNGSYLQFLGGAS